VAEPTASITIEYTDVEGGYAGDGNIDADPLFMGYYQLSRDSPCIDTADGALASELDMLANPRVDHEFVPNTGAGPPWVDMGAKEYQAVHWIPIPGGTFWMGSEDADADTDEQPLHEVTVPAFEITRTEVTVLQYNECVEDGICTMTPECSIYHNTGESDEPASHPINCANYIRAFAFCEYAGGRLPSEAEWEFAARGGGLDVTYPWGEAPVSCDLAIWREGVWFGCYESSSFDVTWPVCSRPDGNTPHGLCDMAGNVQEWVEDNYHEDYEGAPTDGSAWYVDTDSDSLSTRVLRGGSTRSDDPLELRTTDRDSWSSWLSGDDVGIRCAR
jgi:formylglycine-generating enzyme required for sulfatase activity